MKQQFTLTVVIPNYNNGRYLSKCVESIVGQTYRDLLEIIIVDDCSTDDSRDTILALAEKYPIVKPLLLEKNGKVSAARNAGLYAAKGEYITFVDADDCYYNKEKISNEMALIEKHLEQGEDVVAYSSIVRMSNNGKVFTCPSNARELYFEGNIYKRLLVDKRSSAVMRDYCIKKSLLQTLGGYNEQNSLFEDLELILKIAKNYKFYFTGAFGTAYRDSVSGLSKRPPAQLIKAKNSVIEKQIATEPIFSRAGIKLQRILVQTAKKMYKAVRR